MYKFQQAVPVWGEGLINEYNQFLGFYTEINLMEERKVKLAIAARSYYRLYINGKMIANGPARTAKNYCRIDEILVRLSGKCRIAVEVVALDKPEKYSNDCTLEPGLFVAEITAGEEVLSATGDGSWRYMELLYRKAKVELMSHSRGIIEVYELDEHSYDWLSGVFQDMQNPVKTEDQAVWLKRRAPYPTYRKIEMELLQKVSDMIPAEGGKPGFVLGLSRMFHPVWYGMLKEEDCFLESLTKEREGRFTGELRTGICETTQQKMVEIKTGGHPASVMWSRSKSELGFLHLVIDTEEDCVLDVVNSDHMHVNGELKPNSYGTRYILKKGHYDLTTFEPKLIRYVKVICRTKGTVRVTVPQILDYSYPDEYACSFACNDGELNMIYEAARRTLRLNTLDIFMDCPERERGGWLCDSYFTAYGAWQIFGDLSVEKDFLENFMLTDPKQYWHAFFPEVYPGSKAKEEDPGIANWSFWLLAELSDYYRRSGDREFIEKCRTRVACFMEGLLKLRGESGLLEGFQNQFVDWSLSNKEFCLLPVSIPNNCLAVYMMEEMASLYGEGGWAKEAAGMRKILESIDQSTMSFGGNGDGAVYENGSLRRKDCPTESGIALELWSGFHGNDKSYIKRFIETMGTCPKYRRDPNIGKANLFIGLMIRFDVLSKLGKVDTLVKELKDVYLPEIIHGPGTLFEGYAQFSGCHGFNAAAGAYIVNDVLGLGQPMQLTKTIRICPHPGELLWASGSAKCCDGDISMNWTADHEEHILDVHLYLPKGWEAKMELPFELKSWDVRVNGRTGK